MYNGIPPMPVAAAPQASMNMPAMGQAGAGLQTLPLLARLLQAGQAGQSAAPNAVGGTPAINAMPNPAPIGGAAPAMAPGLGGPMPAGYQGFGGAMPPGLGGAMPSTAMNTGVGMPGGMPPGGMPPTAMNAGAGMAPGMAPGLGGPMPAGYQGFGGAMPPGLGGAMPPTAMNAGAGMGMPPGGMPSTAMNQGPPLMQQMLNGGPTQNAFANSVRPLSTGMGSGLSRMYGG